MSAHVPVDVDVLSHHRLGVCECGVDVVESLGVLDDSPEVHRQVIRFVHRRIDRLF
jgi:hypothetical protein